MQQQQHHNEYGRSQSISPPSPPPLPQLRPFSRNRRMQSLRVQRAKPMAGVGATTTTTTSLATRRNVAPCYLEPLRTPLSESRLRRHDTDPGIDANKSNPKLVFFTQFLLSNFRVRLDFLLEKLRKK